MKYLYANGCSFVYGDELSNPNDSEWLEKKRWSRIFSDKYGVEEINESKNGSSNNRIYRTTKEWILNNESKLKDTFVVVGWSQAIRTERFNDMVGMYEAINFGINPDNMSASENNGMDATGQSEPGKDHGPFFGRSPSRSFWRQYEKYYFNELYFTEESALRVFALQELLNKLNVKYYFYFSMETMVLHYLQQPQFKKIYDFKKIHNKSQEEWIMDEVEKETGGTIEWDNKLNTFMNPKGGWSGFNGSHPDEKSHEKWADFLYKNYRRLYK